MTELFSLGLAYLHSFLMLGLYIINVFLYHKYVCLIDNFKKKIAAVSFIINKQTGKSSSKLIYSQTPLSHEYKNWKLTLTSMNIFKVF